ncbi:unnamed protein product [Amoebophrya sp. A120]|nr:unnamed protein product [Amoebophrya sp. A120]|eukprot:GSA120T00007046001.1
MSMKKLQVMKKQAEKPDMMQHARGLLRAVLARNSVRILSPTWLLDTDGF